MVMIHSRIARLIGAVTLTLAAILGLGRPASADSSIVLPAGEACTFELRVDIVGENQVQKTFVDKNGNPVRTLSAGKGSALTFTNTATGATLSFKPNGSVTHTTINPDGSTTVIVTGHDVLILFPTDVPAGPSTTLYVGRVVFTVDTAGVFTLQEVSGNSTDICVALA
jgi:hypothetical protein